MPRLSRWAIRLALLHLALGLALGAWLLAYKGLPLGPSPWPWLALHREALLLGWTAQLAMGVAYWILPRLGAGRGRGDPRPAWLALAALNLGVVLSGLPGTAPAPALAGRLLTATAALAFAWHAWPRIRGFGA